MVRPFVLQRPEEPFHHRVVIATACATHRAFDAQRFQRLLISGVRILATTIAVMQELVADRPTRFDRDQRSYRLKDLEAGLANSVGHPQSTSTSHQ